MRATVARRFAGVVGAFILVAVQGSWAGDEVQNATRRAHDAAKLQSCIRATTASVPQYCIGRVSDLCVKQAYDAAAEQRCYQRESAAWQALIEHYDAEIRHRLAAAEATRSFVEARVLWIDGRDQICRFSITYFAAGTSDPWVDRCYQEEDGRRAIYLNHLVEWSHGTAS